MPRSVGTSNTSFTDELGLLEFYDADDSNTLNCLDPGIQDISSGLDKDDTFCISCISLGGLFLPPSPFVQVGVCLQTESDFS